MFRPVSRINWCENKSISLSLLNCQAKGGWVLWGIWGPRFFPQQCFNVSTDWDSLSSQQLLLCCRHQMLIVFWVNPGSRQHCVMQIQGQPGKGYLLQLPPNCGTPAPPFLYHHLSFIFNRHRRSVGKMSKIS